MKSARSLLAVVFVALLALPALAANRAFNLTAPAEVPSGTSVKAQIAVSTDAKGEQIGFLQAEYSTDGGETWTSICYDQDLGARATRSAEIQSGAAGSTTLIRARVAFRGGSDGDVDFRGDPLQWDKTWSDWSTPPAKVIRVVIK